MRYPIKVVCSRIVSELSDNLEKDTKETDPQTDTKLVQITILVQP